MHFSAINSLWLERSLHLKSSFKVVFPKECVDLLFPLHLRFLHIYMDVHIFKFSSLVTGPQADDDGMRDVGTWDVHSCIHCSGSFLGMGEL